jgi:phosphoglucosamine mutase
MSRDLFGTDGVRGVAGEYPLDTDGVKAIAKAVGVYFAEPGKTIVIGQDTRESSAQIVEDLISGLNEVGVNSVCVEVLPTPGLAYLTHTHEEFVAGIMVTASHNTYKYNGIKVFDKDGGKLADSTENDLNDLIEKGVENRSPIGESVVNKKLINQYEDFLVETASSLQLNGLLVAIDSANGASSKLAERVFKRLGANVTALFDQPNGRNINENCGATDIAALRQVVLDKHLALGIALDGDADRLIMVDERGREVKGDYLLYILAVVRQTNGVVATIMSNQGFEIALQKKGIELLRTDVGDRYVLEGLKQTGYKLGGETSGHIIFPLVLSTGDGLLAAVQTLRAINTSNKSLAQWCDEVELLPQALVNIPLADKSLLKSKKVQDFINSETDRLKPGRMLIRPSGTEPLVRVMVEAPNADEEAEMVAAKLEELLKKDSTNE